MKTWIVIAAMAAIFATISPARAAEWTRLTAPDVGDSYPVYDGKRDQVLLLPFGNSSAPGEFWSLQLSPEGRWRRNMSTGTSPDFNRVRAVAYDARRDRVLVLERDPAAPFFVGPGDLTAWSMSLGDSPGWRRLVVTGPVPQDREAFAFAYDSKRDAFILFGGADYAPRFNDVWRLHVGETDATWELLAPAGDSVSAHSWSAAIYDARRDRLVVFGGLRGLPGGGSVEPSDDLLALDFEGGPRWTIAGHDLPFNNLAGRPLALYDANGDRMLVFAFSRTPAALALSDLSTWTPLDPGAAPPQGTSLVAANEAGISAVAVGVGRQVRRFSLESFAGFQRVDPGTDAIDAVGGPLLVSRSFPSGKEGSFLYWGGFYGYEGDAAQTLWRFDPASDPHWTKQPLTASVPAPRGAVSLAYDGRRHRWLMYGGYAHSQWNTFEIVAELWAFDPLRAKWTQLTLPAQGGPGPLAGAAMAYDGFRDRLVLFGGERAGDPIDETWALGLGASPIWERLATSGLRPRARGLATAVWDPSADRIVLVGGSWWSRGGGVALGLFQVPLHDTWSLTEGSRWDSLAANPAFPRPRAEQLGWLDLARSTIDVLGNVNLGLGFPPRALVSYSLNGPPAWSAPVEGADAPATNAAAYLPEADRMIAFAGRGNLEAFALDRNRPTHQVFLDVSPREIRSRSHAPITVALLGDALFDPANVDPASLVFAGAPALADRGTDRSFLRDVNGDGLLDRLVRFDSSQLALAAGDRVARLDGKTRAGTALVGFDLVQGNEIDRMPFAASGDPDSPTDSVRPLGLVASAFSGGRGTVTLNLPVRTAVRVEMFGANGRRIGGRDLGTLDPGSYSVGGLGLEAARPGIYFARVMAETETAHRRIIVLP